MNAFAILCIVILLSFAVFGISILMKNDWEAERKNQRESEWNRRLAYLHDFQQDKFEIAGQRIPYRDALEMLNNLKRGRYPIAFDGRMIPLDEIETFIEQNKNNGFWYGRKNGQWFCRVPRLYEYDAETRENFRSGKIRIGYYAHNERVEDRQLRTFEEAERYMNNVMEREMRQIWKT